MNKIYDIDLTSNPSNDAVILDLTKKHIILEILFNNNVTMRLSNKCELVTCRAYLKTRKVKGTSYSGAIEIPIGLQNGGSIDK